MRFPLHNAELQNDLDAKGHRIKNLSGSNFGLRQFIFDEDSFGAVAGEDCTEALNEAIGTMFDEGGGELLVPMARPEEQYIINGPFQDTGRQNAQILLPVVAINDKQITIKIRGEVSPAYSGSGVYPIDSPRASTFKSTQPSPTGSTPSLLGGWGPVSGVYDDTNYLHLELEDLVFEVPPNPVMSALYLWKQTDVHLRNILVHTGALDTPRIEEPTHAGSYGIILPQTNAGPRCVGEGAINVFGFYLGMKTCELMAFNVYNAWMCKRALEIPFNHHGGYIQSMLAFWCPRALQVDGPYTLTIDFLDIEKTDQLEEWFAPDVDLYDAGDQLRGRLNVHNVTAGVGADSNFTRYGGLGIEINNLVKYEKRTSRHYSYTTPEDDPETVTMWDDRHTYVSGQPVAEYGFVGSGTSCDPTGATNTDGPTIYDHALKPGVAWINRVWYALNHTFQTMGTPRNIAKLTGTALRLIRSLAPQLIFENTGNASNAKKFRLFVANTTGDFHLKGFNDAEDTESGGLTVSRAGELEPNTLVVSSKASAPTGVSGKNKFWTRASDGMLMVTDGANVSHQLVNVPAAFTAASNPDTSGAILADLETEVNQLKAVLRSAGLMT